MNFLKGALLSVLAAGAVANPALAREPRDRDLFPSSGPRTESQGQRNMREAREVGERVRAAELKEAMRDKSHDYRLKVGSNTSIGSDGSSINVRHGY
jgi:hypothetical protein